MTKAPKPPPRASGPPALRVIPSEAVNEIGPAVASALAALRGQLANTPDTRHGDALAVLDRVASAIEKLAAALDPYERYLKQKAVHEAKEREASEDRRRRQEEEKKRDRASRLALATAESGFWFDDFHAFSEVEFARNAIVAYWHVGGIDLPRQMSKVRLTVKGCLQDIAKFIEWSIDLGIEKPRELPSLHAVKRAISELKNETQGRVLVKHKRRKPR
jgi:hypothetical protein